MQSTNAFRAFAYPATGTFGFVIDGAVKTTFSNVQSVNTTAPGEAGASVTSTVAPEPTRWSPFTSAGRCVTSRV